MQMVLPLFSTLRRFIGSGSCLESGRARLRRELAIRETLRFFPKRKLLVRCQEGLVWITTASEAKDVILAEGEQFTLAAGSSVVIEGLWESVVEIAS